ncbi:TspO/MBR family protein [Pseudarthrobacter sp. YS3]|uniref:TspO/MBR family protein n=1 Tax=Pseudarthrobacter sp. YS3 TaxID=3453718 RepID=UPI003EE91161
MPANVPTGTSAPAVSDGPSWPLQLAALLGFLALSWAVSLVGSIPVRIATGSWYSQMELAPWSPPGMMFTYVWLTLYAAMAVAAWLVWRQRRLPRRIALRFYGIQLALNLLWPMTFFGLYPLLGSAALWLALAVLAALFLAAILTVAHFGPISRTAGVLMLPNISWLVFSASLNLYAAVRN